MNLNIKGFGARFGEVTLKDVALKFEMSSDFLIGLLRAADFIIEDENIVLNDDHLKIISDAYIRTIKRFYRKSSKEFSTFGEQKQVYLRRFFNRFVKNEEQVFNKKLEDCLIREYFDNTISALGWEKFYQIFEGLKFSDLLQPIKLRDIVLFDKEDLDAKIYRELNWGYVPVLRVGFSDIRSKISAVIVSGHYYIFSSEEDETAVLSSMKRCFSAVNDALGEALTDINGKLQQKWIKYNYQKI